MFTLVLPYFVQFFQIPAGFSGPRRLPFCLNSPQRLSAGSYITDLFIAAFNLSLNLTESRWYVFPPLHSPRLTLWLIWFLVPYVDCWWFGNPPTPGHHFPLRRMECVGFGQLHTIKLSAYNAFLLIRHWLRLSCDFIFLRLTTKLPPVNK